MRIPGAVRIAGPAVLLALLTACGPEAPPPKESVRAVRTVVVAEPANGRARRFSGLVEAANVTRISFEVSGSVRELRVGVGERIVEGQIVAVMDDSRYRLNVESARAAVRGAEVALRDAEATFERLRQVNRVAPGAMSALDLEQAEAARDGARQNLSYATTRLNLAERDLRLTTLRSPFAGVIARRHVDAFQQVNRGEKIFDLFMDGGMEAVISVPESEVGDVFLGLPGEVRLPAVSPAPFEGIVSEVSEVAGAANAFPVRLAISGDDSRIRPGLTAEVTLRLGGDDGPQQFLIPLGALAARPGGDGTIVYRYDPDSSTVRQVPVEYADVRGGDVVVKSGLAPGDIIVVAGVTFLRDGQAVRLMN